MPLTNIQILRSAVPYKRPDVTFLLDGQLALNYKAEEPGLFTKLQNGDLIKIGPTSITTNGDFPNQNPDPTGVAGNSVAEKWFDDRAIFHSGVEKIWDGVNWRTVSGFTLDDATGDMEMLRTLGVDTLNANAVNINGGLDVAGDITPNGTSCLYNIGGAGQRFNSLFGCDLDIQFGAQIGTDLQVLNDLDLGNDANITGNLFVTGQSATFGQNCLSGNFTVETPTFFNCDTNILGELVVGGNITTVGDLDIGNSARIGNGCGVSTFVVDADTTFNCPVTFSGSTFFFGTGCATSSIVWNGAMEQRCDLIPSPASTVNIGSATDTYLAVHADNFEGGDFNGDTLTLTGKAITAATLDTDAPLTLTTKGWVEASIINAVTAADEWERVNGNEIRSNVAGNNVVMNGTGSLGTSANFWDNVFADNLIGQSLTLGSKATSAATVDADPDNTLVTKKWVEDGIDATVLWQKIGTELSPRNANDSVVPNGVGTIGTTANRWTEGYFNDVFTNDLHLKNERGDWTMIEEEDVLTLRNNKTGKRYAISMTPYVG